MISITRAKYCGTNKIWQNDNSQLQVGERMNCWQPLLAFTINFDLKFFLRYNCQKVIQNRLNAALFIDSVFEIYGGLYAYEKGWATPFLMCIKPMR